MGHRCWGTRKRPCFCLLYTSVVAYKLVEKLYEASGVPREEWRELLEFAAIATVGDVMRLQDENRILVKYGLKPVSYTHLDVYKRQRQRGPESTAVFREFIF